MTSWVQLGNDALIKLGHAELITSLTDGSKAATLINQSYENVRDIVLREHPWNFAKKRVSLSPLATGPSWGGGNYFQLPSDWLRTLTIDYPEYMVRSEGNKIWYDGTTLNLMYIYRVADVQQFDALFSDAYSYRLAQQLAMPMANSYELMKEMMSMYKDVLMRAKHVNATENTQDQFVTETFIGSRL